MIEEHELNGITYRPFRSDADLKAINDLFSQQFSEPYQVWTYRFFAEQYPSLTFFAEHGGQPVGCCMGMLQGDKQPAHGYIGMICVADEYKQKKIGMHLAELALQEFQLLGCGIVTLETEDDNFRAIYFYERLGFIKTRHHYRYYLNGKGAYQMAKWLRDDEDIELSYE